MKLILSVLVNALALAAAAWLVDGIELTGDTSQDRLVTLLVAAVIFGAVNTVVAPVVKLLSLPLVILTLGLLLLVINALMLMLTGWLATQVGFELTVDGFWAAVLGSIVVTVASWLLDIVLPDRD